MSGGIHAQDSVQKKHMPVRNWTRAEKDAQIAHLERNKDHILFHANFGCFLPDDKKHLIKLGENGE